MTIIILSECTIISSLLLSTCLNREIGIRFDFNIPLTRVVSEKINGRMNLCYKLTGVPRGNVNMLIELLWVAICRAILSLDQNCIENGLILINYSVGPRSDYCSISQPVSVLGHCKVCGQSGPRAYPNFHLLSLFIPRHGPTQSFLYRAMQYLKLALIIVGHHQRHVADG